MMDWLSSIVNNIFITDKNNDINNNINYIKENKMTKNMINEHNKKWVKIIRNNTFC
jgi:hypothetical protein